MPFCIQYKKKLVKTYQKSLFYIINSLKTHPNKMSFSVKILCNFWKKYNLYNGFEKIYCFFLVGIRGQKNYKYLVLLNFFRLKL